MYSNFNWPASGYRALHSRAQIKFLGHRLDNLHHAVARIDLFAETNQSKLPQPVHISRYGSPVAAQFGSERRDAEPLLSRHLAKSNPLRRNALQQVERVLEGNSPLCLEPLPVLHSPGAFQRTPHVSVKSIAEQFGFQRYLP
jgi:hypothetical protein